MVCHPPLALNGLHARNVKSTEMQRHSRYGQGDRTSRGPEPQPRPYRPRKYPVRCPPTCYPSLTSQHPRDRGRSPPKTPQSPPHQFVNSPEIPLQNDHSRHTNLNQQRNPPPQPSTNHLKTLSHHHHHKAHRQS